MIGGLGTELPLRQIRVQSRSAPISSSGGAFPSNLGAAPAALSVGRYPFDRPGRLGCCEHARDGWRHLAVYVTTLCFGCHLLKAADLRAVLEVLARPFRPVGDCKVQA